MLLFRGEEFVVDTEYRRVFCKGFALRGLAAKTRFIFLELYSFFILSSLSRFTAASASGSWTGDMLRGGTEEKLLLRPNTFAMKLGVGLRVFSGDFVAELSCGEEEDAASCDRDLGENLRGVLLLLSSAG
jgi:hypothetical protein